MGLNFKKDKKSNNSIQKPLRCSLKPQLNLIKTLEKQVKTTEQFYRIKKLKTSVQSLVGTNPRCRNSYENEVLDTLEITNLKMALENRKNIESYLRSINSEKLINKFLKKDTVVLSEDSLEVASNFKYTNDLEKKRISTKFKKLKKREILKKLSETNFLNFNSYLSTLDVKEENTKNYLENIQNAFMKQNELYKKHDLKNLKKPFFALRKKKMSKQSKSILKNYLKTETFEEYLKNRTDKQISLFSLMPSIDNLEKFYVKTKKHTYSIDVLDSTYCVINPKTKSGEGSCIVPDFLLTQKKDLPKINSIYLDRFENKVNEKIQGIYVKLKDNTHYKLK